MANTISEYPTIYLDQLDEVLALASFATRYGDPGAEFVGARNVKVPDIAFGGTTVNDYDGFKTENPVSLLHSLYTLDHDKESVFNVDAVDDIDSGALMSTQAAAQYERTIFAPYVDTDFFSVAKAKAKATGTTALTAANIKAEIRKARSQFAQVGLMGGDLYMSSAALALLEDATNREWSNETSITDTVGSYDGFTVFEVPDALLGTDFTVISGGKNTIRYITKRAVSYLFAPGTHTSGDCWLSQHRWVFGTIVRKNKVAGIYCNKAV